MEKSNSLLPQSKVGFVLLVLLLIIVLVTINYLVNRERTDVVEEETNSVVSDNSLFGKQFYEIDSDEDGLKDWEEVLWETNPADPDTDGDGTKDGEEVLLSRSPTVPGPEDKIEKPTSTTTPLDPEDLTQTAKFSRAFINTYLDSKIAGVPFDNQLNTLTGVAVPELENVTLHKIDELITTENTSEDIIHEYGNSIGSILMKNTPGVENELIIILRAIEYEEPETLLDLAKTVESYQNNAWDLLQIPVPEDQMDEHVQLVNSFLLVARDISYMQLLLEDPLTGFAGLQNYLTSSESLSTALDILGIYLSNHTKFEDNEDGYILIDTL